MPSKQVSVQEQQDGYRLSLPIDAEQFRMRDPFVKVGIKALGTQDYDTASSAFNHALKLEPQNPYLHFLNALTYQGDFSKADMAVVGYNLSRRFDSAAWWNEYFNGLLALEQKHYDQAQSYFARALLLNEDNIEIMKGLIAASYYMGDLQAAHQVLNYALNQKEDDVELLRSATLVYAAAGDNTSANQYLQKYTQLSLPEYKVNYLTQRVHDWHQLHVQDFSNYHTVAESHAETTTSTDDKTNNDLNAGTMASTRQVIVDVVIIRSEERSTDRRGINLLNGLSITFGLNDVKTNTELGNTAAASAAGADEFATFAFPNVFSRTLSIPSVNYSLNIFNTIDDRNEVISPSHH